MKVIIYNNTHGFHCGSTAVMEYLMACLSKEGHKLIGLVPNVPMNYKPWQEMISRPFDALIVNGEGTLHHDTQGARRIADAINVCLSLERKVYLVNTVWQDIRCISLADLKRLHGVIVREDLSRQELVELGYSTAKRYLDLSFFQHIDAVDAPREFLADEVMTDFYLPGQGFVEIPSAKLGAWRPTISLKSVTWSQCISVFKQVNLVVTGRHHAVYAACRARTPFAALAGNTHKIEGLIASSGLSIPVASSFSELPGLIEWARRNRPIFEKLFDWMESQPAWKGISDFG